MELNLSESMDNLEVEKIGYDPNKSIKQGIWIYFILLIFEGALRKWFLPGLANPLLVIRDPVAIWLIFQSLRKGLLPSNIYLNLMVLIGVVSFVLAMNVGHGNFVVALYGARIFIVHFPLIFIIGRVFDRDDIIKLGKVTLYIGIPMALLIAKQFYSPQSAWVNRGLAGDLAGAGFGGIDDFKRPPGTFSFILGTTLFFGFLAPFLFYFWFNLKKINIYVLIAASGAMLISIPFSISRTLAFEFALTVTAAIVASAVKPENLSKVFLACIIGIITLGILSQTKFFNTATEAFSKRFTTADESEGGLKGVIGDRFLGGMISAFADDPRLPFFGYGVGLGTNVGAQITTGGRGFVIAELEWARLIGELGPFLGITVIIIRMLLVLRISIACFLKMIKGDLLPWLLLSFGFIVLAQGQWAQPTSLGFCVIIVGLTLAALRTSEVNN